jgi:cytochrome c-type biogenesis protein CcsB
VNAVLYDVALTAYIVATAAALGYLVSRRDGLSRFTVTMTQLGWVCHTVALVVRGVELGRPPLLTLPELVSVVIWAAVLLELWAERQYRVKVLGAFVLPVVLALGLMLPTGLRALVPEPSIRSAWIWVHVVLALLGLAALVLNFAGAVMYLLQERQLKAKRPGAVYYRLPSLETLDQLTYRTLTFGFPFLTAGLVLGVLWAQAAWGSIFTLDPLAILSYGMWIVYAATLSGRAVGAWRGRRAAYFAIAGFCVLLLTLGAGVIFQGRHGS